MLHKQRGTLLLTTAGGLLSGILILAALLQQSLTTAADAAPPDNAATYPGPVGYPYTLFFSHFEKDHVPLTLPPSLPPPVSYGSETAVHFPAARLALQEEGLQLVNNKIGFHVGPGGNATGLADNWWRPLDAAGVPVFLKSVDSAGPLYEVQQQMALSGVPHTLVFRRTSPYNGADPWVDPDVPDYNLSPAAAAVQHWEYHKEGFPPELDKEVIWFETVNEVDKNRAPWLAQFALETAKLAVADGYKWAAFGWSAGEPEPEQWESPEMLAFLRYAAAHPDQIAIALHEYSYIDADIANLYPYLIGRFQRLFDICDRNGIARPTTMVTEWGWTYNSLPTTAEALEDVRWAAWLYAAYPEVKGAAIWYLGPGFGGIADKAQPLIAPVGDYSLKHYFGITPGWGEIDAALFAP